MRIFKLDLKNKQELPADTETGDLAVFVSGDIMCRIGTGWKLLGGRFLTDSMRNSFLSYVSTGWSDSNTTEWDLLDVFSSAPEGVSADSVYADPRWAQSFFNNVLEACDEVSRLTGDSLEI